MTERAPQTPDSMMLAVAGYVDPHVRVWLEIFARVPALLAARPDRIR